MTETNIYENGVALLEEWEDVNYCKHSFKFKEDYLTDKEVVDLLNAQHEENEQLKQKNQLLYEDIDFLKRFIEKQGFKAKLESDKR